ncbi:Phosphatidate phosphatase APP1 [Hypsizygus marmoreus]|uniref:Phosphatidate phosphatase APP1 n=1 Tax=Hypsizygus marmoreus TaxID=39966 RepID=A0A369JH60_HYPMA|nr:Phosphatidate phosphatase APP1 [Hypsizygus marmoreus]
MQLLSFLPFLSLLASSVHALPLEQRLFDSISVLDDVLVFDAPAFPDPANPANTLVSLQTFVSLRQIDLGALTAGVEAGLKALGIDIGDKITTVEKRIRLLGAVGLPGKTVKVDIGGCNKQIRLPGTSGLPDLGMVLANVSAGACGNAREFIAKVDISSVDSRTFSASVFPSPNSGFGVISDIDDTVKITNVLDTLAVAKSTLIDDPEPVAGMPELYASLAQSLNSPQFIYVSGSPFQLYPFLNEFIDTTYSASKGPIFLQNLTLVDIPSLLDFASSDGVFEYKVAMVDRIHGMYPGKKFLTVGDSTQMDPETYGEAFRKYGDFIACIWIRRVEGADNNDARFAAAFAGVPVNKTRIYTDADIPTLKNIDVAGGKC